MSNILLTGGSRGIGAAIAAALAGETLAVHATGGDFAADFADPAAPGDVWERALAALGSVDVLINNAGVFEANPIDAGDAEWTANWDRTLRINLTASAELCRLAILDW
ncbi:MAG: SDR family NAD(P)-dependent oxidoreductase, partial [Pseudomonadota bacterium]